MSLVGLALPADPVADRLETRRCDEDCAGEDSGSVRPVVEQGQSVPKDGDEEHAQQDPQDAPPAARERDAADEDRGQDVDFEADAKSA